MSAHTKGPWIILRAGNGYPYQIHAPNGDHVKDVTRWASISVPSLPEGEANARLIAAAPTMYDALQLALVRLRNNDPKGVHTDTFVAVQDALAAAERAP